MADDITRLRQRAREFSREAQRGELGYMGDGNGTIRVSGKSNRVYVRVLRDDRKVLVEAKNAGAPDLEDLEVWVSRTPDRDFVVTGLALERDFENEAGQPISSVATHGHDFASGMLDIVAGERFLPGHQDGQLCGRAVGADSRPAHAEDG